MSGIPRSTYRLQFHGAVTFDEAAKLADYLAALGVSHLYASPYFQAAPGSRHGYDVVDPGRVSRELGGEEGHARLCRALEAQGLGQILDIVPNHMAITGSENAWWWDVLENGPSSRYAIYFDVEWDHPDARLSNRILLPVLGDHYGRILEAGEIVLRREGGRFAIHYHEHAFPVAPRSLASVLERAADRSRCDDLGFLADALTALPLPTVTDRESIRRRHRDKEVIRLQLERLLEAHPDVARHLDAVIEEFNADPDLLDDLLENQNYRLALWRTARRDLGYRRFFDINAMAGLRVEDGMVFGDSHRLVLTWLREGRLDGLRVDHPDGLRDPEEYLWRLRQSAPEAWIVVEKILHPGERLPASWLVQGTTGYDFLNLVGSLFVEPASENALTEIYCRFTGEPADFAELARAKKRQVMRELLGSEINRLVELMIRICERHRRYRDYTREDVRQALEEIAACFPVYRTYVRAEAGQLTDEDRRIITQAVTSARDRCPELDPHLFGFLQDILLLEVRGELESELVMRFQQLTGPITAKGIEDTAFYVFNRLIALNEVGGDPARMGVSVEEFHRAMQEAAERRPQAMLTTSTHDTKRSEDVRARLVLLSEMPQRWEEAVLRWSQHNRRHRRGERPDRNAEYLLYHTLAGAWPISTERTVAFMGKAAREAKRYTSWHHPDAIYEEALRAFVTGILADEAFVADLESFVTPLVAWGRINSLAQVLLKMTAPGVPDIYQGTELWDLSLVDPDNRRPVDFDLRRRLLAQLEGASPEEILARSDEGLPKLWLIRQALRLRDRRPDVFLQGEYRPLALRGGKVRHAVAFRREAQVAVVVPRLVATLGGAWDDTEVELPAGSWRNELTGDRVEGGWIELRSLLARFPVALLDRDGD